MQQDDIEPSLRTGETLERLDDGFSPPVAQGRQPGAPEGLQPEAALTEKSQF
jgi:hypothetical protein